MLILNNKTTAEVLSFEEVMQTVERAMVLHETGAFGMPDRMHLDMGKNSLLLMPCNTGHFFGTKLVSVFPENARNKLPYIMGTMVINDGTSGKPLAIIDASALTALRTGAVGGVAIKYLAPENATSIGLIGTGVQGLHQAFFACTARKVTTVFVLKRRNDQLKQLTEEMSKKFPAVSIQACQTIEELVQHAEIIITATNSDLPVLPNDADLLKGKTVIAIGSYKPTMRELPNRLFPLLESVYVDTYLSKKESGDIAIPLQTGLISGAQIKTLGSRIKGNQSPPGGTNLFKSVGMALFDLITGQEIYTRAKERGLGVKVDFD